MSFKLGHLVETGQELSIHSKYFNTHAAIFGMTGSGKTGLGIIILEEALINDIPVLVFDVKGDVTNLALKTSYSDEDKRLLNFIEKEILIITPGSNAGFPLSISGLLSMPKNLNWDEHEEILLEKINTISEAILNLVHPGKRNSDKEKALLAALIEYSWKSGEELNLEKLVSMIIEPPFKKLGVLELENFFPSSERRKLAIEINKLLSLPSFKLWRKGVTPDIDSLLWDDSGKPRAVIFYLAHLNESQRMFTISLILQQIYGWMFEKGSSDKLRALIFFDEIYGYLPPYPRNPPTKHLLMLLFKQARAFGVALVISTQNPIDVDYKVLSNTGLWFIGKLKTANDRKRLVEGVSEENTFYDRQTLENEITSLNSREFILINSREKSILKFKTRDTYSDLKGPLTLEEIRFLCKSQKEMKKLDEMRLDSRKVPETGQAFSPPLIPDEIPSYYLPAKYIVQGNGRGIYKLLIYVRITAKLYNRKLKINKTVTIKRFLKPLPLIQLNEINRTLYCLDAELLDVNELSDKWSKGFVFESIPSEYLKRGIYRRLERKIKLLISTELEKEMKMYYHQKTGLISRINENYDEFKNRIKDELITLFQPKVRAIEEQYVYAKNNLEEELRKVGRVIHEIDVMLESLGSFVTKIKYLILGKSGELEGKKAELIIRKNQLLAYMRRLNEKVRELDKWYREEVEKIEQEIQSEISKIVEVPLHIKKNSLTVEIFMIWVPVQVLGNTLYNCFTGEKCHE